MRQPLIDQADNAQLNQTLGAVLASRSWRITKPLRMVRHHLQKVFPQVLATVTREAGSGAQSRPHDAFTMNIAILRDRMSAVKAGYGVFSFRMFSLVYVPLALTLFRMLLLSVFVHRYGVNVIRWDEWSNVDIYKDLVAGRINLWEYRETGVAAASANPERSSAVTDLSRPQAALKQSGANGPRLCVSAPGHQNPSGRRRSDEALATTRRRSRTGLRIRRDPAG